MIDFLQNETGYVVAGCFLLIALLVLVTWRASRSPDAYLGGILSGIGLALLGWMVARTNEEKIEKAQYQAGIISRFIGGLKNLFIRK